MNKQQSVIIIVCGLLPCLILLLFSLWGLFWIFQNPILRDNGSTMIMKLSIFTMSCGGIAGTLFFARVLLKRHDFKWQIEDYIYGILGLIGAMLGLFIIAIDIIGIVSSYYAEGKPHMLLLFVAAITLLCLPIYAFFFLLRNFKQQKASHGT